VFLKIVLFLKIVFLLPKFIKTSNTISQEADRIGLWIEASCVEERVLQLKRSISSAIFHLKFLFFPTLCNIIYYFEFFTSALQECPGKCSPIIKEEDVEGEKGIMFTTCNIILSLLFKF